MPHGATTPASRPIAPLVDVRCMHAVRTRAHARARAHGVKKWSEWRKYGFLDPWVNILAGSCDQRTTSRWGLRICINITFFFWWVGWATSNLDPCYQGGKLQLKLSSIERVSRTNFRPSQWTRVIDRLTEEYRLLLSLVAGTYHSLVAQTVTWCIK
jgi:hypothetical protein